MGSVLLTVVVASVINAVKVSHNVACHKMCFSFSSYAVTKTWNINMNSSLNLYPDYPFLIKEIFQTRGKVGSIPVDLFTYNCQVQ